MKRPRFLSRKLLILPPLALGALVLFVMARGREEPEPERLSEPARPVRAMIIEAREIVPRAIGYGSAQPARIWRAIAEVGGRVEWLDSRLQAGDILPADLEVVRIDKGDYLLAVARLEADIRSTEAEGAKLDVTRRNTEASLEPARDSVALAQRELERLRTLVEDGTVSPSTVDSQESALLRERAEVVGLENTLRTVDADEGVLEAQLASATTRLDEAKRDIERTTIVTPFPCRVASVDIELAQYVAAGSEMFEVDGLEVAEIEAQMAIERVRHLMRPEERAAALQGFDSAELWRSFGLEATVRMHGGGFNFEWPARFARASGGLDPKTRTVGFVAAVDDPYGSRQPSGRPPVVKGMFLEVEFSGEPLEDRIVIPIWAIHEKRVYLIDDEDRLVIRPVVLEFVQFDEAVVASGLAAGERLVLTDLIPAVPGMLLAPSFEPEEE